MQKGLKEKLDKLSREQLLDLLETLCGISEAQNMLKLMVSPSKRDIDRTLDKFRDRCEIYITNVLYLFLRFVSCRPAVGCSM